MSDIVEIADLVKHFPVGGRPSTGRVVHAVDGVSVAVPRGRTLAVVGESGCGKSTIAKTLVGLVRPTSGRVVVAGEVVRPVSSGPRAERRRVQLVSQNPWSSLNQRNTVRHIITQPLLVHRIVQQRQQRQQRAAELIGRVGLNVDYLDRRARELSGGELQRVSIARALAVEPDVLVLDEPTASLDVSVKAILVNLLVDLQKQLGLTYVLITHELDIARHLADRVAVMYLGQFVEVGDATLVLGSPRHPYTRSLLAAAPSVLSVGRRPDQPIEGEVPSAIDLPAGCRFHTRCRYALDHCRTRMPELVAQPDGSSVACLRINELPYDRLPSEKELQP